MGPLACLDRTYPRVPTSVPRGVEWPPALTNFLADRLLPLVRASVQQEGAHGVGLPRLCSDRAVVEFQTRSEARSCEVFTAWKTASVPSAARVCIERTWHWSTNIIPQQMSRGHARLLTLPVSTPHQRLDVRLRQQQLHRLHAAARARHGERSVQVTDTTLHVQ